MTKFVPTLGLILSSLCLPVLALPLPRTVESPAKAEAERQAGPSKDHPHVHTNSTYYKDGTYVLEYRDEYGKQIAEVFPAQGAPYSMQIKEPTWTSAYDNPDGRAKRGSATWELLRW